MDILVHVDHTLQGKVRLETAIAFAQRLEARLIGIVVITEPDLTIVSVGPAYRDFYGMLLEVRERDLDRAVAEFEAAVCDRGLAVELRKDAGLVADRLALQARYADLAVIGQSNPHMDIHDSLDHILPLTAGGPVLVVPYMGKFPVIGERPLVAWNGSREAARAVKDALPVLRRARKVDVIALDTGAKDFRPAEAGLSDLAAFLARQQVAVETSHMKAEDTQIGEVLLSRMADLGSDLLVMGAYGHSRFYEIMLGGATRSVLRNTPVPVWLSH